MKIVAKHIVKFVWCHLNAIYLTFNGLAVELFIIDGELGHYMDCLNTVKINEGNTYLLIKYNETI